MAALDNTWRKIQLFDAAREGPQALTLVGHEDEVTCLAFAPQGDLASVSKDGTLRTWNLRTGQETSVRIVGADTESVVYSLQGDYFATGGSEGAKLWATSSSRLVRHWSDIGKVFWIAFDANGKRLAGGGREGDLKVWDVVDGKTLFVHRARGEIAGLEISSDSDSAVALGTSGNTRINKPHVS